MTIEIGGKPFTIDDENYSLVKEFKWTLDKTKEDVGIWYAVGAQYIDGRKTTIRLHRLIMGCSYKDGKDVDHINGDTLDNRKENLRVCTHAENCRNQKRAKNNKSGYRGVYLHKQSGKWRAVIGCGKRISLGLFSTPELAHEAYKEASIKYHGEYGRW